MTQDNKGSNQSYVDRNSGESVRLDEGRSYNHTNTAKDSSAERPRVWSEVQKPKADAKDKKK